MSITAKNTDCSAAPLARPFARSLAPLTRSLAPDCSLCSRPPLRSLVRSLVNFAHFLARGTVNDWMAILSVSFSIFDHSVPASRSHNLSVHLSEHLSVHTPVSLYVLLNDSASVRVTNITTGRACKSFAMPMVMDEKMISILSPYVGPSVRTSILCHFQTIKIEVFYGGKSSLILIVQ